MGRQLLVDLTDMGIPVGSELLDTISPQYIAVSACLGQLPDNISVFYHG